MQRLKINLEIEGDIYDLPEGYEIDSSNLEYLDSEKGSIEYRVVIKRLSDACFSQIYIQDIQLIL